MFKGIVLAAIAAGWMCVAVASAAEEPAKPTKGRFFVSMVDGAEVYYIGTNGNRACRKIAAIPGLEGACTNARSAEKFPYIGMISPGDIDMVTVAAKNLETCRRISEIVATAKARSVYPCSDWSSSQSQEDPE